MFSSKLWWKSLPVFRVEWFILSHSFGTWAPLCQGRQDKTSHGRVSALQGLVQLANEERGWDMSQIPSAPASWAPLLQEPQPPTTVPRVGTRHSNIRAYWGYFKFKPQYACKTLLTSVDWSGLWEIVICSRSSILLPNSKQVLLGDQGDQHES